MRNSVKYIAFFFALLSLTLFSPLPAQAAREYKPVEQLGQGRRPVFSPIQQPHQQASRPGRSSRKAAIQKSHRTYISPTGAIKLFGTVEYQRPLKIVPQWLDVLKRNSEEPIFKPQKYFNKKTSWEQFRKNVEGKSQLEQMQYVNKFWNAWPYKEDMANWGRSDYWAIPAQFLPKSGDCEDYAITKYFTLKELGFDPQKMRIVVLRDTVRNLGHAVLAVYQGDDVFILDNLSNVVLSHKNLTNYYPQFSVNENGRWNHIMPKK